MVFHLSRRWLGAAMIVCGIGSLAVGAAAEISIYADPDADARMDRAVVQYRAIVEAGGWHSVPQGRMLQRDSTDARIDALRARLRITGDLAPHGKDKPEFDARTERAVRRFQARHGLAVDGIVGPATLEALNVPATNRLATLEIDRKRLDVLRRRVADRGIVVNVAAATLELIEEGNVAFRSRVIVGQPGWPTPLLHSEITALDVNPPWYVPPRIARRELFPRARREPDYLARLGIRVFSVGDGAAEISYDQIDWDAAMAGKRYRLRQDPGPQNAMGAVRFDFANPYGVFLHDTPDKTLFAASYRWLSHGCIRVENATDLAAQLVARDRGEDGHLFTDAVATGRTSRLTLTNPVPVHLVYLTAWVDRDGRVQFRRDIYRKNRPGATTDPGLAGCRKQANTPGPRG